MVGDGKVVCWWWCRRRRGGGGQGTGRMYDAGNVLLRQAYQEVFDQQMEEVRLRNMLHRIQQSRIIITYPQQLTPFCFPIKVDSLRENLTSEKLEDRVRRMQQQLERS